MLKWCGQSRLADFEHNPVAAVTLAATGNDAARAYLLIRAMERGESGAHAEFCDYIQRCTPTPSTVLSCVAAFRNHMNEMAHLPACAACGVRATPGDSGTYEQMPLDTLRLLMCTPEQVAVHRTHPLAQQQLTSVFQASDGCWFHLHPELVSTTTGTAELCGNCLNAVRSGNLPVLSIASGIDFPVHCPTRSCPEWSGWQCPWFGHTCRCCV